MTPLEKARMQWFHSLGSYSLNSCSENDKSLNSWSFRAWASVSSSSFRFESLSCESFRSSYSQIPNCYLFKAGWGSCTMYYVILYSKRFPPKGSQKIRSCYALEHSDIKQVTYFCTFYMGTQRTTLYLCTSRSSYTFLCPFFL